MAAAVLLFVICQSVQFSVVRDAVQCLFVGSKDGATHGNDARARAAIWTWHEGRWKTQRRESGRVLRRGQELQPRQRLGQTYPQNHFPSREKTPKCSAVTAACLQSLLTCVKSVKSIVPVVPCCRRLWLHSLRCAQRSAWRCLPE